MAKRAPPKRASKPAATTIVDEPPIEELKIRPATIGRFRMWLVGTTPLITHAWSEKAKRQMLGKQKKEVTGGKVARNPKEDFLNSLYQMADGVYGFPATGLKKAILTPAHKDRGVPRSSVLTSLWLQHEMIRVGPALQGAICDLPLIRIYSAPPEMREDMVRVGSGLSKKATLAYRGQFWPWAIRVSGRYNADVLTMDALATLMMESGMSCGIGEWRNEKSGIFGSYRLAQDEEIIPWEKFRKGTGKLPPPPVEIDPFDDDDDMLEAA